jgi:nitrate reductase gamma subunit
MFHNLNDVLSILLGAGFVTAVIVGVVLLLARKEAKEAARTTPEADEMPERLRRAS